MSDCYELDDLTIQKVFEILENKYESKEINNNKKELVHKTLQENADIKTFFDNNKIFKYDELVNLICILLPEVQLQLEGGGDEVVKYEKPQYFGYDRKSIKYDIFALCSLIVSFLLLYLAYANFIKFAEFSKLAELLPADYNEFIQSVDFTKSELTFFEFSKNIIFDWSCNTRNQIANQMKKEFLIKMSAIIDLSAMNVEKHCFTQIFDDPYLSAFTKMVENYYNPSQVTACSTNIITQQVSIATQQFNFDLTNNMSKLNSVGVFLKAALGLGVASTSYLSYRIGLKKITVGQQFIETGGKSKKSRKGKKVRKSKKARKSRKYKK